MALACPLWAGEQRTDSDDMQDAPSGLTWGQVIILLTACGGTGTLCWQGSKKLHTMTRIEPQPLEVKRIAECASRKELDDFKTEVREDFRRVHNRIDANDRATSEIKGKLDVIAQNQQKLIDLITQRHG